MFRNGLKLGVFKLTKPKSTSFTVIEGPNQDEITLKGESASWSVRSKSFGSTEEWGDRDSPKVKLAIELALKLEGEKIVKSCSGQITPTKDRSFLITAFDSTGKMISKATFIHAAEGIALILTLGIMFMVGVIAGSFALFTSTSNENNKKSYTAKIMCELKLKDKVERFHFEACAAPITSKTKTIKLKRGRIKRGRRD